MVQAEIVYGYFKDYTEVDPEIEEHVEGDVLRHKTVSVNRKYFSCVTASQKQVRGKHPDVLLSDETCETEDQVVQAAIPTVSTSENPLVVMASTFHQIFGIFQDTWDNAEQYGYTRFEWDIFDVTKEFSPDIWKKHKHIDDIDELIERADGRTGDPEGWIPIENVIQAWKEKPTLDWFDIEYMGSRPSATGLVLKPEQVDITFIDEEEEKEYPVVKGAERVIGIDWGFSSMTSVVDMMRYRDDTKVLVDNKNYTQVDSADIIKDVVEMVREGGHRFILADIEGKFENSALQNELNKQGIKCEVIEVNFGKEKTEMVGNLRAHFEKERIKIPHRFKVAYWQLKRYRYQPGTDKPMKGDDHIPDAIMCALQKEGWQIGKRESTLAPTGGGTTITGGLQKKGI